MATEPSIKGSALASLAEDLRRLRDEGRFTPAQFEARLAPEDLALLDAKIRPSLWYPIASYQRFTETLLHLEGGDNPDYLVKRGARAAERIWESGIYTQLASGEEKAQAARERGERFTSRDARLMTTLAGSIFNFSRWTYREEGEYALIELSDAAALPEVATHVIRGFLQYTISRLRRADAGVNVERPMPDRIVFRYLHGR